MKEINMKYIPLVLFVAQFLKMLFIKDITLIDSLTLAVLGSLSAFYEYKTQDKAFKILTGEINKLSDQILQVSKESKDLKTHVSGIQLGKQFKING